MTRSQLGTLQMTVGAALISFSPVFVKIADVGPTMAGFYRMLFGGTILAAIIVAKRHAIWHGARPMMLSLLCGALFAADLMVWHRSIHYVGPGLSTLLANFQVFFLAAFGVLMLGEKLGRRLILSILMAVIGLFLMVGVDFGAMDQEYRFGVLLGLITAGTYASFLLAFRKLRSDTESHSSLAAIAVISLAAAALMAPVGIMQGESFIIPDPVSGLVLVLYGLIGQVLGWVIISWGISKVQSSRVGLILLLQPTLAFVWDVLFFGRPTKPIEVVGALIALAAIYLGSPGMRQKQTGN